MHSSKSIADLRWDFPLACPNDSAVRTYAGVTVRRCRRAGARLVDRPSALRGGAGAIGGIQQDSAAVIALVPGVPAVGLPNVELATDPDDPASIGLIEKAGGHLVDEVIALPQSGGGLHLLFQIIL
ncbi:MAG: hypothetical protein AAGI03_00925 [Pseudomonadota bacterium]